MKKQEKIKVLIVTLGGERQRILQEMFNSPGICDDFVVEFSPGVHQRELRNRVGVLKYAHLAGILPDEEWNALEPVILDENRHDSFNISDVLRSADVKVNSDRNGSKSDKELYFSEEFWRKAKSLSRDRSVLACTFAHLIAMRRCIEIGADVILEDNVRMCSLDSAQRIREAKANASGGYDLIYFGWLGSLKNLAWVIENHSAKSTGSTFPFPTIEDYEDDNVSGTALWGAYAYHINEQGYNAITSALKRDVGGLLWKGKRMRAYLAKPIDKVMPRRVKAAGLRIEVTKKPVFFRAPMLTSRIHAKWDPEFCKSTEYQLSAPIVCLPNGWDALWLTESERQTVAFKQRHGQWCTTEQIDHSLQEKLKHVSLA